MTEPFRLIVTGWRGWPEDDRHWVEHLLWKVAYLLWNRPEPRTLVVVDGACPFGGVDDYAHAWARRVRDDFLEIHPIDWERYPARVVGTRVYGSERNQYMVDKGGHLCFGFPGPRPSRGLGGTRDCMLKALDAGIPVKALPWLWTRGRRRPRSAVIDQVLRGAA